MARRRHRLASDAYAVPGLTWLVTFGTRDRRQRPLGNPTVAAAVLGCFVEDATHYGARLHLAAIMPDHAHLILEIADGSLLEVVRNLKSRSTRAAWEQGHVGALWQPSFYDRGLRGDEFVDVLRYVLENPVRAGLVAHWEDYPFIAGLALSDAPSS